MDYDLHPAIVVIAYNRPDSLIRLLGSIARMQVPDNSKPRLVISIDGGGDSRTIEVARDIIWAYGEKVVIEHDQNLGLKEHMLQCGDMSQQYGAVILLEDDLVVSPAFYLFACAVLKCYAGDDRIAGISLYSQRVNETAGCIFEPINNGHPVFLSRMPSSWGQAFTARQWKWFRGWLKNTNSLSDSPEIPDNIRRWPESSWKKYFCDYTVHSKRWFIYPYDSYTTNFGDVGQHHVRRSTATQVELTMSSAFLVFPPINDMIRYDLYWELVSNESSDQELEVVWDVYGTKTYVAAEYVVSCKSCEGYKKIQGYAQDLRPVQLNYFMDNQGDAFWLQKRNHESPGQNGCRMASDSTEAFLMQFRFSRCEWMPTKDLLLLLIRRLAIWVRGKLGMAA